MPLYEVISGFFERRKFRKLESEQKEAVVDALAAAMMADGEVAGAEKAELDRALKILPWEMEGDDAFFVQQALDKAQGLEDEEAIEAFCVDLSARLGEDWLRDEVYLLSGRVVGADREIHPDESVLLRHMVKAFGLSGERLRLLTSQLIRSGDV